jgi:hypothetical protein
MLAEARRFIAKGAEIKMVIRSSFSPHSRSFVRQFVDGNDYCHVPTRHAKCGQKNTAFKKFEDSREVRAMSIAR